MIRLAGPLVAVALLACGSESREETELTSVPATAVAEATRTPETASNEPAPGTWGTRAALLDSNSEIAVAELAGKIYVIGGYPSSRVVVNAVQVYDVARDSWSVTQPLPAPLHHTMAAASGGKLYVIGGETAGSGATLGQTPPGGGGFVNTVYEYDPARASWTAKAPMPTARSGGAVAVIEGKIYVAGGRPPGGSDFAVYDQQADRWTVLPSLPTQRNHMTAAAIGGKVYVAGGRFGGGVGSEMTAVMEVFDPATNRWESKAALPRPRAGVNGVAARGCFYVFGGEGNDSDPRGVFAEMDVYNPKTNAWSSLPAIPTPVHGVTGSAYVEGLIFLAGGGTSRGGSSGSTLHQVFRPDLSCE